MSTLFRMLSIINVVFLKRVTTCTHLNLQTRIFPSLHTLTFRKKRIYMLLSLFSQSAASEKEKKETDKDGREEIRNKKMVF